MENVKKVVQDKEERTRLLAHLKSKLGSAKETVVKKFSKKE